ncbi:Alpha-D-phosphohexomutase alpha/beta/alpha I/II/III [Arabidopsis thaliana x Arabidopsis arenosa]|uniref:phosphoglucomutase (alpha-D-glucose-1,6-bisphosphate-dependent) n=2 Tax=Arabidopsis thaliana x Arabidopsis arenosa TaxID=1240361 RepID=A0A8T2BM55_9BRAS|nr:Alpha-D-phosphohexomutase alpha/beta/alpha I/II/III [Arabidopsis thaliana x Arabidopsis arenosa]
MSSTSTSSLMASKTVVFKTALFSSLPGIVNRSFLTFAPASPSIKPLRTRCSSVTKFDEVTNSLDEDMDQIRRLQNGSDVRGVALEGEKGRTVDLTPAAVEAIAESFGEWVAATESNGNGVIKVSLGRDPRVSGGKLSTAVFAGLARAGCLAFDMGLATTPACFMSTLISPFEYDASIMMTASHLPYTRNGLKFFTKRGGLTSPEVEKICDLAARKYATRQTKVSTLIRTRPTQVDFMSAYSKHLREIIKERINHPEHYDTPLKGFQIVVNAGNGSGGFFTWDVLDKLGADTFGSLYLNPDGMFPNHIPNPENKIAMSHTRAAVLENSADLGVVFDTDVDRSGVVDNRGNPINGDKLIALMSAIVLKEHPGSTIVTDARTSMGLTRFITERGGRHCLYRVGYRNVIDKGVELNKDGIETHLMMETSGHGAVKENHFLDDGAYMVVKIIIEMVRMRLAGSNEGIGSLIEDLEEPLEAVELRLNILSEPRDAKAKGIEAIETFREYIEEGKLKGWELGTCGDCWVSEGCLVDSNDHPSAIDAHMYRARVSDEESGEEYGWVHMRQSIHNPNIALNMQSMLPGGCLSMTRVFRDQFLEASGIARFLDISDFDNYIGGQS